MILLATVEGTSAAASRQGTRALRVSMALAAIAAGCASTDSSPQTNEGPSATSGASGSGKTSVGTGSSGGSSHTGSPGAGGTGSGNSGTPGSTGATGSPGGGPTDAGSLGASDDATTTLVTEGGAPPGPGGFPKNDAVNTDRNGPYMTASYTAGLDNPAYNSSIMYYPTDAPPPYAAAVFSPGFSATKEDYQSFLGPLMASHGMVILLTTPTTTADLPTTRAVQLEAAVKQIATENTRDGSPLKGKLAPDRVCVTGHSMGGGGTLWAAQTLGNMIRCAVPCEPWQPGQTFPMVKAPTLFIAAQDDTIAPPAQNASIFYDSIPAGVPKYYAEFSGGSHFLTTPDLGSDQDGQSKYMIAFYKVYLEDDLRYMSVLTGPPDMELSAYKHSP